MRSSFMGFTGALLVSACDVSRERKFDVGLGCIRVGHIRSQFCRRTDRARHAASRPAAAHCTAQRRSLHAMLPASVPSSHALSVPHSCVSPSSCSPVHVQTLQLTILNLRKVSSVPSVSGAALTSLDGMVILVSVSTLSLAPLSGV